MNLEDLLDPYDPYPQYPNAVLELVGDAGWCVRGEGEQSLVEWIGDVIPEVDRPTHEEINQKLSSLISEWESREYQRNRRKAFSNIPIGEQLDMQYWDSVNGTTIWLDWVSSIKAQFPKP